MNKGDSKVILVLGVTGFIGSQVALTALQAGYSVRGVVRSLTKADLFKKKHAEFESQISFTVVPDVTTPGAFDEAVKGVDFIFHIGLPTSPGHTDDNEGLLLKPSIDGTQELLRAAEKERCVKQVIITCHAVAAIGHLDASERSGHVYSELDWFPATYEDAVSSKIPYFVYSASQGLAEKNAWQFMEEKKPSFTLTTLLHPIVFGENQQGLPISPQKPITGMNSAVAAALNPDFDITKILTHPSFVDIRDLANAHIVAIENHLSAGERFIITQVPVSPLQYIRILSKEFPGRNLARIPDGYVSPVTHSWDGNKAQELLGLRLHPPEVTLKDTANWILRVHGSLAQDTHKGS